MLELCNLPKAKEEIIEVTSNHLESCIYFSKNQRGLSLSNLYLFGLDVRIVITVHRFVYRLVGYNRKGRPLGNGVKEAKVINL